MVNIALVDDHVVVAQGFKHLIELNSNYKVDAIFTSSEQAVSEYPNYDLNVMVVDIALEQKSGIELIHLLKQNSPNIKTIALSMYDREPYISEALKAGANGYISKRAAPDDIVNAINAALSGETYLSEDVKVHFQKKQEKLSSEVLTDREAAVLRLLTQGLQTKEIAYQLDMAEKTAHSHKYKIYSKLGTRDQKKILQYALLRGYVSVDEILQE